MTAICGRLNTICSRDLHTNMDFATCFARTPSPSMAHTTCDIHLLAIHMIYRMNKYTRIKKQFLLGYYRFEKDMLEAEWNLWIPFYIWLSLKYLHKQFTLISFCKLTSFAAKQWQLTAMKANETVPFIVAIIMLSPNRALKFVHQLGIRNIA